MKNTPIFKVIGSIVILSLVLLGCTAPTKDAKPVSLTILCASSAKNAMKDIQKLYSQEKRNVSITYNFAPSGMLQKQIQRGTNADLFISSGIKQMDALQSQGLVLAETRQNLLSNKMVLIAQKDATDISDFKDLTRKQVKKVALADPQTVSIGKYSLEVLSYSGILNQVKSKLVFVQDPIQIVGYVENKKTDTGIVLATDAILSNKITIVAIAPEKSHSPIIYPAAVLKHSKNIPEAKAFLRFLQSHEAEAVFLKYRFTVNSNAYKQ